MVPKENLSSFPFYRQFKRLKASLDVENMEGDMYLFGGLLLVVLLALLLVWYFSSYDSNNLFGNRIDEL